jgi:hypothetical protein
MTLEFKRNFDAPTETSKFEVCPWGCTRQEVFCHTTQLCFGAQILNRWQGVKFSNMRDKWYFKYVNKLAAGQYRIIFELCEKSATAGNKKKVVQDNRLPMVDPVVLEWTALPLAPVGVKAKVVASAQHNNTSGPMRDRPESVHVAQDGMILTDSCGWCGLQLLEPEDGRMRLAPGAFIKISVAWLDKHDNRLIPSQHDDLPKGTLDWHPWVCLLVGLCPKASVFSLMSAEPGGGEPFDYR